MILLVFLLIATAFLAYANGANDNFKGVATLFGSKTTNYKTALIWATGTTFAGSVASVFLAGALVKSFSGKGLVPDSLAGTPEFLLAVALGTGTTVLFAALLGFPISTTHSLTGALVGTGLIAVGQQVNFAILGSKFVLPLLISPFIAAILAGFGYPVFSYLRKKFGVHRESTLYLGKTGDAKLAPSENLVYSMNSDKSSIKKLSKPSQSATLTYTGEIWGISAQKVLDAAHFFSAGVVSFARGLNDTPKIVALLLAFEALGIQYSMLIVGIAMAIGGLINARKVAETMSKKITPLNAGQGFTANIATGLLVVFASRLGMPVSTTHVSVGSLFGIGTATGGINKKMMLEILSSWVLTLPIAAILSALVFWTLT